MKKFFIVWIASLSLAIVPIDNQATQKAVKKVVVFDIGGVLLTYSKREFGSHLFKAVIKECGFFKTVAYVASQGSKLHERLHRLLHNVLEEIGPEYNDYPVMYDEQGKPHPRGICLLQAGILSSEEFVRQALQVLMLWWNYDKLLCKSYRRVRSKVEMTFIAKTIQQLGNGELLAQIFRPCKAGMEILQKAIQTPHVEVMILSNYPIDQFADLLNQPFMKQALYNMPSTHIFCSGQKLPALPQYGLGERRLLTKPHPAAFGEIILFCHKMWNVAPHDIIFIDNQPENIAAAQRLGIDGILVNSQNKQLSIRSYSFKELDRLISLRFQVAQLPQNSCCAMEGDNNLVDVIKSVVASKTYANRA